MVNEAVQQRPSEPFRAEDLGPLVEEVLVVATTIPHCRASVSGAWITMGERRPWAH